MALHNFGVVEAGKLYRGAQPDVKGFNDLWTLGVRETLVLNGANDNTLGWAGLVLPRAMSGLETVEEIEGIVEDLQRSLDIGRTVYVHCTHGRDRTGCIVGAWRIIKCGWTFSKMEEERLLYGEKFVLEVLDEPIMLALHEIAKNKGLDT
jgi:tyrosine-protein phosphatase SIW14